MSSKADSKIFVYVFAIYVASIVLLLSWFPIYLTLFNPYLIQLFTSSIITLLYYHRVSNYSEVQAADVGCCTCMCRSLPDL